MEKWSSVRPSSTQGLSPNSDYLFLLDILCFFLCFLSVFFVEHVSPKKMDRVVGG